MRLNGKHGKILIGTTSGGSDLYAGADLFNWEANIEVETEDMEALEDDWLSPEIRVGSWEWSAEKYVTTPDVIKDIADRVVSKASVYVALYRGGATAAGAVVINGNTILNKGGITNPNGPMEESIGGIGKGTPTVAAS